MTESVLAKLGIDRLPTGQRDRRVTELLDLTGRVAVVTGGGGANIGSACVDRLASAGATVVVLDRDIASAAQSADGRTCTGTVRCRRSRSAHGCH